MRDQHIADIRAACIKANPEIAELKQGCHVWVDDSKNNGEYSIWELIGDVDIYTNQDCIWRCVYSTFATVTWGNFKLEGKPHVVLGRPIRLADVLLAINIRFEGTAHLYSVDDLGGFYRDKHVHMQCYWNLRKDDLTQQSDETIAFLADLLGDN